MSLKKYDVKRDMFQYRTPVKFGSDLCFPCCVCLNNDRDVDTSPCNICDHNVNAMPQELIDAEIRLKA